MFKKGTIKGFTGWYCKKFQPKKTTWGCFILVWNTSRFSLYRLVQDFFLTENCPQITNKSTVYGKHLVNKLGCCPQVLFLDCVFKCFEKCLSINGRLPNGTWMGDEVRIQKELRNYTNHIEIHAPFGLLIDVHVLRRIFQSLCLDLRRISWINLTLGTLIDILYDIISEK